ncbi:eEF1A lysine and N-terminal methyltransferase isoform X8 [Canis lupus familiaris]|uniref:eEF1A lysine and N-terminal methyltransferase isoform X4 n=1 Tax=Canis lupus dingo TaxID=286419 RepID=UPI00005A1378|nr:eEF1A lysine and N-terminal methyltransferase isoform X4 [Canis lupus dingo]XP_038398461.1 eEF1A lysine and N-terminal methyltransferase isoform X8 [Canis lupus familiaris]XP_038527289.1 eEF1A lysine and N-terminal methyltransferase isoform X4 [Canis lupus familiaris]|eukprot:XP_861960.1 methyltransferase-like protein 13 isoform X4 [Canis lupus familiaris]
MNLLPKSAKDFGSVDYWEKFFQQRGKKAFEWYGSYLELCGVLHKYIKPREKVLVIGCGNSELSEQLYDVGYQDIVNIDISEVVIKQMKERNASRRPQMSFLKMDMTQMEFPDASFQVVLDKGTLDAVLTDEEEKTLQQVDRMLAEVGRVLQGRETEWLFGMEEGRKQLAATAGFRRLITVALHRGQQYEGMDSIQAELSARVMELAPAGMPSQQQVPFLSVGGDIGVRTVQHQNCSPLSGSYVVEDVQGDDKHYFRRLIFLSNRNVVQSEARLLKDASHRAQKKRKKDRKKQRPANTPEDLSAAPGQSIDKSYLCCEHHKAMIAGLALLRNPELLLETPLAMLVVGLGGGSLPLFVHDHFPKSCIDAVEIDPSMLDVATQWFGFSQSERMKVHIADGLDYITSLAGREARPRYNVIMFDVDSKDPTLGMSCPPPAFVDQPFLQKVKSILTPEGVFILNLVCRDLGLKDSVLTGLKAVFPLLYVRRIEGEVNEILFCQLHPEQKLATSELLEMAQALEQTLRKPARGWDDTYILSDMLKTVKIV